MFVKYIHTIYIHVNMVNADDLFIQSILHQFPPNWLYKDARFHIILKRGIAVLSLNY